jgi:hypothetical protein
MLKEAVIACLMVLTQLSLGGTEKTTKTYRIIACASTEIRIRHLPYTGQKRSSLCQLVRYPHACVTPIPSICPGHREVLDLAVLTSLGDMYNCKVRPNAISKNFH